MNEKKEIVDLGYDELLIQIKQRPFWAANKLIDLDNKLTEVRRAIGDVIAEANEPIDTESD